MPGRRLQPGADTAGLERERLNRFQQPALNGFFFSVFQVLEQLYLHGGASGIDGRQFQHRDEVGRLFMFCAEMAPGVSAFGLGVTMQVENLHVAIPDGLAVKDFADGHGFTIHRAAIMHLRNRDLNFGQIILLFRHVKSSESNNVRSCSLRPPVQAPRNSYSQKERSTPASNSKLRITNNLP